MISRKNRSYLLAIAFFLAGVFAYDLLGAWIPANAIALISAVFFSFASKKFIEHVEIDIIPVKNKNYLKKKYLRTTLVLITCAVFLIGSYEYIWALLGSFFGSGRNIKSIYGEFMLGVIIGLLWNEYERVLEDRKKEL
jgi:hypothetical protein